MIVRNVHLLCQMLKREKKVQKPQTLQAVDKRWAGNGEVEKSANEAVGGAATKLYMMKRKRGWVYPW